MFCRDRQKRDLPAPRRPRRPRGQNQTFVRRALWNRRLHFKANLRHARKTLDGLPFIRWLRNRKLAKSQSLLLPAILQCLCRAVPAGSTDWRSSLRRPSLSALPRSSPSTASARLAGLSARPDRSLRSSPSRWSALARATPTLPHSWRPGGWFRPSTALSASLRSPQGSRSVSIRASPLSPIRLCSASWRESRSARRFSDPCCVASARLRKPT